ncbi:DUF4258 domain-containing protein [Pseudomonas sp. EL_65y_Pfl2_R95]|uniref:DUF4258 domain-containing protein n=1 Tax=Pseudomonas sp. EL_65y_Pfl2_R95 TaxID=3088698 RepID=UPI0030DC8034
MSKKPPWTRQQLEKRVHLLAQDSNAVVFSEHSIERLYQRGITLTEALRCLRRGSIIKGPSFSAEHWTFVFRMAEPPPRGIACMVVAVSPSLELTELFVVTVWEV